MKNRKMNRNMTILRKGLGFKSVQKWADRLGESASRLREYEYNGRNEPPVSFLHKISIEFGFDLTFFISNDLDDTNFNMLFTKKLELETENQTSSGEELLDGFLKIARQIRFSKDEKERNELINQLLEIHIDNLDKIDALKDKVIEEMNKRESFMKRLLCLGSCPHEWKESPHS